MDVTNKLKLFTPIDTVFWIFAAGIGFWMLFTGSSGEATSAILEIEGTERYHLNLASFGPVTLKNQHPPVEIVITADGVAIASSACPRKICVSQGAIRKPGQMIICVPFKILIYIPNVRKDESTTPTIITG